MIRAQVAFSKGSASKGGNPPPK